MALVTVADVKNLVNTNLNVDQFIETADLIVTEQLGEKGLSPRRLRQIELYLAAHFAVLAEERGALVRSKIGASEQEYAGKFGDGLLLTRYGQQAVTFDDSGTLASIAKPSKLKAQFDVVTVTDGLGSEVE